jgi:hypothetical protein
MHHHDDSLVGLLDMALKLRMVRTAMNLMNAVGFEKFFQSTCVEHPLVHFHFLPEKHSEGLTLKLTAINVLHKLRGSKTYYPVIKSISNSDGSLLVRELRAENLLKQSFR